MSKYLCVYFQVYLMPRLKSCIQKDIRLHMIQDRATNFQICLQQTVKLIEHTPILSSDADHPSRCEGRKGWIPVI